MSRTTHAERVNPPTTFFAGDGVSVKVWPTGEENKYPQAVIEQSCQNKGSDEWITNEVYIDNRALLALALCRTRTGKLTISSGRADPNHRDAVNHRWYPHPEPGGLAFPSPARAQIES